LTTESAADAAPLGATQPQPRAASAGLLAAVARGDFEASRAALAQGADVNAVNSSGQTALMLAALRGDDTLVELLLQAGADTRRTDRSGASAADLALRAGHDALAQRLRLRPP
jgi:ankyrin repeat protein